MIAQVPPFRRHPMTLRQLAEDPGFSKGWYVKLADDGEPYVIPLSMYLNKQYMSENNPAWGEKRTAFFNERETVVLLKAEYSFIPLITLLHWTAALDYMEHAI